MNDVETKPSTESSDDAEWPSAAGRPSSGFARPVVRELASVAANRVPAEVIPISARRDFAGKTASVVINTYNRAAYLSNAIRSVAYQTYPAVELIVVNGPSTDDTERVLESLSGERFRFKSVRCAGRNLSESRNLGIAEAAGDVVLFIDDDAVAHPDWIARLMAAYEDPEVGAAGGFTIDHTGMAFQCRYTVCDRFGNAKFLNMIDPARILEALRGFHFPSLLGTNCSFRRSELLAINGFDETYAYFLDETDVCLRIFNRERRIVTVPDAYVFHKYAPSDLRSAEKIPNSLFAPAKSKAHFIIKHGVETSDNGHPVITGHGELERYTREVQFSNRWYLDHEKISTQHYLRLDADLHRGVSEGIATGLQTLRGPAAGTMATRPLEKDAAFLSLVDEKRAAANRDRLKIYFVSQGYPPADTSGIARWTHECARSLIARGHEVHVVTRSQGDSSYVDFIDGVWIHAVLHQPPDEPLPPSPVDIPDSLARRAAAVFAEIKRAESIWGVSVVSAPIWDLEGLYCVRYLNKPVITSLHTTYLLALPSKPDWLERPQYRRAHVDKVIDGERWLLQNSARILANSEEIVREIDAAYGTNLRADPDRVHTIPHGISDTPGASGESGVPASSFAKNDDTVSILFVGRIEARKGLDQLLQALLRMRRPACNVALEVVGSWSSETDSYAERVKQLASEVADRTNIPVRFVGYADDAALPGYYERADIFVAPSRFESFGLIVIEAMRSGCPVIASDIGGMREIVDETTGFLVKVDDYGALASRLQTLLADSDMRKAMGAAGRRKFASEYTAQKMAARLEAHYQWMIRKEVTA
jgi:glycogen(starch) synthase